MPAAVEHDLLGARQRLGHAVAEAGRDQLVVSAPDEERRGLQLGQPRVEAAVAERAVEVDVARRSVEGDAGAGAGVVALELVDHDVSDARVQRVGVAEHRPELALDHAAAQLVGQQAQLGAQKPHEWVEVALDERDGGTERGDRAHTLGPAQAHLQRDAATHRVADEVGGLDLQRVHHAADRLGEPRCRVRGGRRLGGAAEAGQVERVDAVAILRQQRRAVEERGLGRAEAVDQQDVGALTGRQGRDVQAVA
jgi:hypothetical protein